jgi:hypothetical protein
MFVPMFVDKDRDEDRDEEGKATTIGTRIETKMAKEIYPGGPTSASAGNEDGPDGAGPSRRCFNAFIIQPIVGLRSA